MTLQSVEIDRLESLETYDLEPDLGLQGLADLAAAACDAPRAYVLVADRDLLRFVACAGVPMTELAREGSFSSYVVAEQAPLVVTDARADQRFARLPQVVGPEHIRAYAGVPLISRDGLPLGVLCVLDVVARDFSPTQLEQLRTLAESVVTVLELRRLDRMAGVSGDLAAQGRRLRRALEQDELVTWFQPIVSLETGHPEAFEALVRWEHPQRGLVAPLDFLPAVEHSGLSMPVGRYVLHTALRTLADLRLPGKVSVNISPMLLARPGLAASVLADLEAHRIDPSCLAVEVTEQGLSADVAREELATLRAAGVRIALDDYGIGRSSLSDLVALPLTSVKIHGWLVERLDDERVLAVVRSTVALATELGLSVVAEGVETEAQRIALLALGCKTGQGHLFSPAVPVSELPAVLARLQPSMPAPRATADHSFIIEEDRQKFLERSIDLFERVLRAPGPVVLIASVANRVALERGVAARGVNCVERVGYTMLATEDLLSDWTSLDVPAGATVVSDLAAVLWAAGDVSAAIEVEDMLSGLPAVVRCLHEAWSVHAHGTPQQRQRLHEQHGHSAVVSVEGLGVLRPDARELVERMRLAGASSHSIAAALSGEGYPSPSGMRWHWRQVDRLLTS
jgi:EAL domain-containing protein (putative c-di-GMP-specific phosphodiesterase class I)